MVADEGWFHRRRGLPRWERVGHPLDTLTVAACYGFALLSRATAPGAITIYVFLALFSCLFITKDEFVHAKRCSAGEAWAHSLLFVLHPIVLASFGYLWFLEGHRTLIALQLTVTLAFALYQLIYWSLIWRPQRTSSAP